MRRKVLAYCDTLIKHLLLFRSLRCSRLKTPFVTLEANGSFDKEELSAFITLGASTSEDVIPTIQLRLRLCQFIAILLER